VSMNHNKRIRPISRKLRFDWYLQKISGYLCADILFVLGFVAVWVWQQAEKYADGALFGDHLYLTTDSNVGFAQGLQKARLVIGSGPDAIIVPTDGIFYKLFILLCVIMAFQVIGLIVEFGAGYRRSRRILMPIYQMADETANMVATNVSPQPRYTDLQHAIDDLNPGVGDGLLHTGIPELQPLEQSINELLLRIRQADAQQIRFVSDASHELRTPIAVIQGYANLLDRWGSEDPEVLQEGIQAIKAESEQMKILVDQLLFLARGDSGRQNLQPTEFLLEDLAKEIYEESVMIDEKHKYDLILQGSFSVTADFGMLKQAVRILIDNAVKYTPAGERITLVVMKNDRGEPTIAVQDSGAGISKGNLEKVFDRFFRADNTRKQTSGSGLGLSIADWIIKRHGGYFTLTSVPELGSRFCIHLPQKEK